MFKLTDIRVLDINHLADFRQPKGLIYPPIREICREWISICRLHEGFTAVQNNCIPLS